MGDGIVGIKGDIMIKLENVSKKYGNNVVLDSLNLNVNSGEFLSIMGPSGSGKSTLLNIIGAMDKPDSGKVIVNNEEINRFSEEELTLFRKNHVGFIFQFFNLFNNLTVYENVQIPLLISGLKEQNSIEGILTTLRICDKKFSYASQLSGGEQQRVAIARALVKNPDIILADEPTGSLDSEAGENILSILKEINKTRKVTILLVTHDINVASSAEKIIKIKDGRITDCIR